MFVEGFLENEFEWAAGRAHSAFLAGLREGILVCSRCPSCGSAAAPPVGYCPGCLGETEFIRGSERGTVAAAAVVRRPLVSCPFEPPFAMIGVKMDGTESVFYHRYAGAEGAPAVGTRVRIEWREAREGKLTDIAGFVPLENEGDFEPGPVPANLADREEIIKGAIKVRYLWTAGEAGRVFSEKMKEKKFVGARCPSCGKVIFPPLPYCGVCFEKCSEFVELPASGRVDAAVPYLLKIPDFAMEPPIVFARIIIEGSHTSLNHILKAGDGEIKSGMKVRPVWNEEREGSLGDVMYFEPV
ncbi:MAG: zinc ribbon domain-containing protein [bacterium]